VAGAERDRSPVGRCCSSPPGRAQRMLSVRFSNGFVWIHPSRRPGLRLRDGRSR
jgi:hypothetical protein